MSLARQPFAGLTLAAIVGIAAADFFPTLAIPIVAVSVLGAILSLRLASNALVWAVVAATFFVLHSVRILHGPGLQLAELVGKDTRAATVRGIVAEEPRVDSDGEAVFLLRLDSLKLDGREIRTHALIQTRWRGTPQLGDELALFGTIEQIRAVRNPGEFDMRGYLARRDVYRVLVVRSAENGRVLEHRRGFRIMRAAAAARREMQRTLNRGIDDSSEVIGLICGTALGLRHQTDDDIEEPFQQTGTLHLFAVAGLHVGIVARLLWTLTMVLRFPRKLATALIIPALFFYAAITGLHTASVRAAIMGALLLGGIFFDRKVLAFNSLAAAAFLILLFDSNQLFTVGFQLSFAVVGCIVLLADPLFLFFRRLTAPDPFLPPALFGRFRRGWFAAVAATCRGASVSLAAWVGSLPLIYWYFYLITPISLFANLTVVPVAYFVLALALLSLITAPFSQGVSVIFNNTNWLASKIVLGLVHLFAAIPAGHFYLPRFTALEPPLAITVLDEGTGGATYLRANGYAWLFDCGPERSYDRTLKSFLHSRGVDRLEGLFLTHGDAHHIGGALDLINDFEPSEIFDNPLAVRSIVQKRILTMLRDRAETVRSLARDDSVVLGPDVAARILYPPPELKIAAADDAPLIAQFDFDGTNVLCESDAGSEAEEALLRDGNDLRSDILIKGHHHSGDSGSLAFIAAVRPRLIIATSRDLPVNERIGDDWAAEVAAHGIKLFRQDATGAVEIQFRDERWTARAYLTGETFSSNKR